MAEYNKVKPEDRDIGSEKDDNITKSEFKVLYGHDYEYVSEVLKVCFGLESGQVNICHQQLGLIKPNELRKAMNRYNRRVNSKG